MLWDILVLFVDLFGNSSKDLVVLEHPLDSPPEKFLELQTDQLLTGYFIGCVGPSSVLPENGKQKRKELKVKGDSGELPLFVGETDGYR